MFKKKKKNNFLFTLKSFFKINFANNRTIKKKFKKLLVKLNLI